MDPEELPHWLRLELTPGVGPLTTCRLLKAFGAADAVFEQSRDALSDVVGPALAQALQQAPPEWASVTANAQAWLNKGRNEPWRRRVLGWADAEYPAPLLELHDPPPLLWVTQARAMPPLAWPVLWSHALAVVGSRNPSAQGTLNAQALARTLADAGCTIVSGLALGIDTAAHRGALASALPWATVAVVGTGLDRVYPRQNAELARAIAQRGLLMSEFMPGTPPLPAHFPRRNRLIAALSRGTLVVEAALGSGSLITAKLAADMGRDVFAVPGSIHSTTARGCHALIREGAQLVEQAQDILEVLPGPAHSSEGPRHGGRSDEASPDAAAHQGASADPPGQPPRLWTALLDALGHDPADLDSLCSRTGLPVTTLQVTLLELELAGRLARLEGGRYQQLVSEDSRKHGSDLGLSP